MEKIQLRKQPDDFKSMPDVGTRRSREPGMTVTDEFAHVWDALADTPEAAASLRARAQLMREISELVAASGLTQTEAGRRCGLNQPRMSDLMRGRVSRFSLDALVDIATRLGQRVTLVVAPA